MPPPLEPPLLELLLPELLLLLELLLELDELELLLELDELEPDTPEFPPDDVDDEGEGDEPPQAASAAAQISSGSSKTFVATTLARVAAPDLGRQLALLSITPPRVPCASYASARSLSSMATAEPFVGGGA